MGIGDIVLVRTTPPHIASVTGEGTVICEDGALMPIHPSMSLIAGALDVVKALEEEVLGYASR